MMQVGQDHVQFAQKFAVCQPLAGCDKSFAGTDKASPSFVLDATGRMASYDGAWKWKWVGIVQMYDHPSLFANWSC